MVREKILIIDDEPDIGSLFSKILSEEGYEILVSLNGEEGISKIKTEQIDFDRIVGNSPQLKKVLDLVKRVAPHECGSFCG